MARRLAAALQPFSIDLASSSTGTQNHLSLNHQTASRATPRATIDSVSQRGRECAAPSGGGSTEDAAWKCDKSATWAPPRSPARVSHQLI